MSHARTGAGRYYKHNRLQKLRGFCATAEAGSISRAAEELALSQPSVSLQIQSLEAELKTRLFDRRGPRITLTHDGKTLFELAAPLVQQIDRLHEAFEAKRNGIAVGRLDIAAGGSTIMYLLPQFVAAFTARHPRIDLKLHNVTGRDGLVLLRDDRVDLAVGSMVEHYKDISYEPLFKYSTVLIAAPNHPLAGKKRVSIRDAAAFPLILPPSHLTTWGVIEQTFHQHGVKPQIRLEVGGWEVIKRFVALGMGVSIVSSICIAPSDALTVVPMDRYFPQRTYGIVLRRGRMMSPQAESFCQMLRAAARQPSTG